MVRGLNKAAKYHAVLENDKKYDGIFYCATKNTGMYCRPSCAVRPSSRKECFFFTTVKGAKLSGYQACKRCRPGRIKSDLSLKILNNIDAGAVNDKGVRGLADSLHISERHLRRIVHDRTGVSPLHLDREKRLAKAKLLITQTNLPIVEVAFTVEFSSLRQFNDVFKRTFKISPREMRKAAH
ncbi:MAG TPA: Ada metal-binding domain-containing protein [Candidatus Saccharimonadales bacterium]|nr:Ada metal-binding domain-containing protein [Candidatus Saccharimonadales bacterium]